MTCDVSEITSTNLTYLLILNITISTCATKCSQILSFMALYRYMACHYYCSDNFNTFHLWDLAIYQCLMCRHMNNVIYHKKSLQTSIAELKFTLLTSMKVLLLYSGKNDLTRRVTHREAVFGTVIHSIFDEWHYEVL
jgi:hypothetical protein